MGKDDRMCKLKSSDWEDSKKEIRDRVRGATHICTRCFRVSNDDRFLCKPKKIR